MARLEQAEIDRIRTNADIVDVISHYLNVQKQGRKYRCLCPFHEDHDPSMQINTERQIYKCFVCGAGGNVFSFVRDYEKVSFPEAVGIVAGLTGQEVSVSTESFAKPEDPHKASLHKVLDEAIRYTSYQLDTVQGSVAREYLEKRGLDKKVTDMFQIGFNPVGNVLSGYLRAKGYETQDIVDANLANYGGDSLHDVFEGRITFPIHDANGKPIGFSARSMDPDNPSKYINTNETELFHKGNIVYNAHRARSEARRQGKIYVCEGVTDVIAFARAGIVNAVCTLGTSCTEAQIDVLKRTAARIVFCYDGDHAGQAATYRAGRMAITRGCDISVVLNRTGKDPDEIIARDGAEGLKNLVSKEMSWMEFVLSYLENETNMNSYLEKKEMADKAMVEIAALTDETERQYFLSQLSKMTGFHLTLEDSRVKEPLAYRSKGLSNVPDGLRQAEDQILAMMFGSREAAVRFEEELGFLVSQDAQTLAMLLVDAYHTTGSCDPASLMDQTEDETVRNRIVSIVTDCGKWMNEYDASCMDGAIRAIKIRILDNEAAQYRDQLAQALNSAGMQVIMQKYNECLMKKRELIEQETKQAK